jgi:outer membrane protein
MSAAQGFIIFAEGAAVSPPAETWSLARCIARGLSENSGARIAAIRSDEAKAHLEAMQDRRLPSILASASYSRLSEVDAGTLSIPGMPKPVTLPASPLNSTAFRLSLQQPLFTGGRITGGVAQAGALLVAAQTDLVQSDSGLASSIEAAYWTVTMNREILAVLNENINQVTLRLADTRNFLARGIATRNDVLKVEMQLSNTVMMKTAAEGSLWTSRAKLNILIGLDWDAAIETESASLDGASAAPEDIPVLLEKALAQRPDLASFRERIKAAEAALTVARSSLMPGVYLTGDATVANPNQRVFPQKDEFTPTWSVGLLVSMDAGSIPAALAQAKEAQSRLAQARQALAQARQGVTLEVVTSCRAVVTSLEQIRTAQVWIEQAAENLADTRERFDAGTALTADVSDAELNLLSARLELTRAKVGAKIAQSSLALATGETVPGNGNR